MSFYFLCAAVSLSDDHIHAKHYSQTLLNRLQMINGVTTTIVCIIYLSAQLTGRRLPELLLAKRNIGWDSENGKVSHQELAIKNLLNKDIAVLLKNEPHWSEPIYVYMYIYVPSTLFVVIGDILIVIVDSISQALLRSWGTKTWEQRLTESSLKLPGLVNIWHIWYPYEGQSGSTDGQTKHTEERLRSDCW